MENYTPPTDPNLPADNQHIDDDPIEEKPEPEDTDDDSDDVDNPTLAKHLEDLVNLPRTNHEVLEHMKENGATDNMIENAAYEMSEDIDKKRGYDDGEPPKRYEKTESN